MLPYYRDLLKVIHTFWLSVTKQTALIFDIICASEICFLSNIIFAHNQIAVDVFLGAKLQCSLPNTRELYR